MQCSNMARMQKTMDARSKFARLLRWGSKKDPDLKTHIPIMLCSITAP